MGFHKILTAVLIVISGLFPVAGQASHRSTLVSKYSVQLLIQGPAEVTMEPGSMVEYKVGYKNTGSITWTERDAAYLSLYAAEPDYRKSQFRQAAWISSSQISKYKGADVKPGAVAFFTFKFRAPDREGDYREVYKLAAENLTWIPGGQFEVKFHVKKFAAIAQPFLPTPSPQTEPGSSLPEPELYQGLVLLRSSSNITVRGGSEVLYRVGIKNIGKATWTSYGLKPDVTRTASVSLADIRAISWPDTQLAIQVADPVAPGSLAMIPFAFRAPPSRGEYLLAFQLTVAGQPVDGGLVEIPVTVTDDVLLPAPSLMPQPLAPVEPEPIVRIGLFKTTGETIMSSHPYTIQDSNGAVLLTLPAGATATLSYANGVYKAMTDQALMTTSLTPMRALPSDQGAIFTVTSYENRPSWNLSYNDNQFRGSLELRYAAANDSVWLINELPMEPYLKGLVEAGDSSPLEYRKALHVAARAYAYYHWTKKTKHKDRGFDLDARYDQVYRGYGAEKRQPGIAAAVEVTRGMIVRYQGGLALTPYSARTDGRTRSYREVWGADIPYLVSVPTIYDVGKSMWGHGVGLAAEDAAKHASVDGWDWQRILKYYYTGVDLEKRWN